jgi:hypothetical protein
MTDRDLRTKLSTLCQRVLRAELSVRDLHALLLHVQLGPFYDDVAADLRDAVEHTPGKWLSRGVDQEAWKDSEGYLTVLLDEQLLGTDLPAERLAELRGRVLDQPILDRTSIEKAISAARASKTLP